MSEENVEKIRRGQEGFSRGDLGPVKSFVSDDVEWGAVGAWPGLENVYRGPNGMDDWMESVRSSWESFDVSLDGVVRDLDDVLVVIERLRGRGRASSAEVEMQIFSVYWFEQGKIVKRRAFTTEDEALEAAGLRG
jgi:ketosteroid isomerase-like protein